MSQLMIRVAFDVCAVVQSDWIGDCSIRTSRLYRQPFLNHMKRLAMHQTNMRMIQGQFISKYDGENSLNMQKAQTRTHDYFFSKSEACIFLVIDGNLTYNHVSQNNPKSTLHPSPTTP